MTTLKILVSACLLGVSCRYDGKSKQYKMIQELMKKHTLIPVCPEIMGGLATPRLASEIKDGRVMNLAGEDVTEAFERGAKETLRLAQLYDCDLAILKENSPSCGHNKIYDGTFSGVLTAGNGVTADLLIKHGIQIIGESEIEKYL